LRRSLAEMSLNCLPINRGQHWALGPPSTRRFCSRGHGNCRTRRMTSRESLLEQLCILPGAQMWPGAVGRRRNECAHEGSCIGCQCRLLSFGSSRFPTTICCSFLQTLTQVLCESRYVRGAAGAQRTCCGGEVVIINGVGRKLWRRHVDNVLAELRRRSMSRNQCLSISMTVYLLEPFRYTISL
jgi:hypothetical protein